MGFSDFLFPKILSLITLKFTIGVKLAPNLCQKFYKNQAKNRPKTHF